MKIAVLVKQVPDSWSEKKLTPTGQLDRANLDAVLNDLDEYAIEAALQLQTEAGGETTAICMGPESATDAIRRALSMGIDQAIHICDDRLVGADMQVTARTLAAAIQRGGYDLVVCGVESTDARGGVIPAMLAELLDWASLTYVNQLAINGSSVSASRQTKSHVLNLSADLPAVVSVVELANTPRYPNLKGIMAAKQKTVERLTVADLAVDYTALTTVSSHSAKPARQKGISVEASDPNAITQLVNFLRERKLV